ncbi:MULTISPECIES: 50S ribosomal protein L11 methyltransferase [Thermomonosporaceae]|uniref:50S ribosomal protein L11 methyltransferase n=1 Tax=Thermomonosporaceae TaxID=2012 RepID=UPI00255B2533|nr:MULTISPECIES: 50S ribosomal protein L11 methyltransferase [Thermomonosporaceae]MDL4776682.1 50S ribosomal protein L11 methyltransferase [Actinomadura xylanilytica]
MDQRLLLMHQTMLADRPRLAAYDRALERAVGAGDVVADVGAGLLVLSMLALRHGAGHVYAIEADPETAALAAEIAQANDLKGRLTIVQGDARTVRLPEKADVVVSEMMGNLGPEEQMMEVLGAFTETNLAPGGRVVPHRLATRLAAIEFDGEGWGLWGEDFLGHRLDAVQDRVAPAAQLHFFQRPPTLLSRPVTIADHRSGDGRRPHARESRTLTVTRPGRLQAIVGYFSATLAKGVTLSNLPSYPGCNWAVWVWPLRHTPVSAGDLLRVGLRPPEDVRNVLDYRLSCGLRQRR